MRINTERLREEEALELIFNIANFEQALKNSYADLEPCHLIIYLFRLCKAITRAFKKLPIKGIENDEELRMSRLVLFNAAKETLAEGMRVLGIEPLEEM